MPPEEELDEELLELDDDELLLELDDELLDELEELELLEEIWHGSQSQGPQGSFGFGSA